MKRTITGILAVFMLLALAACGGGNANNGGGNNEPAIQDAQMSGGRQGLYGTFILHETIDVNGSIQTPENPAVSLTLKEDYTYELVFGDGNRSTGSVIEEIYELYGLEGREWQFSLRDDRNDDSPSYNFIMSVDDDGIISILMIPQGVGDNSWIETAYFWILK